MVYAEGRKMAAILKGDLVPDGSVPYRHGWVAYRGQPSFGQVGPPRHTAQVGNLVAGRDCVIVESARDERREPPVQDGDHRLIEDREPVDNVTRPDQGSALPVEAHRDQVRRAHPAAEVLHLAGRVQRRGRFPGHETRLDDGEVDQVPIRRGLRNVRRQPARAAQPARSLRLVAPRHVDVGDEQLRRLAHVSILAVAAAR